MPGAEKALLSLILSRLLCEEAGGRTLGEGE